MTVNVTETRLQRLLSVLVIMTMWFVSGYPFFVYKLDEGETVGQAAYFAVIAPVGAVTLLVMAIGIPYYVIRWIIEG